MNRFIRPGYLFLSFLLLFEPVFSQNWQWSRQFGGTGNEALSAVETDEQGNYFIGGSFSEDFQIGDTQLQTFGASDVFLAKLDKEGHALWAASGGSTNIDATTGTAIDQHGNIYWLGDFWIEGFFGTDTLYSAPGSKAVFLLKYDNDGHQLWSKHITGTAVKSVNDIAVGADSSVFLTGYFEDTLLVADTFLYAPVDQQLFVLKLDSEGDFLWGRSFGEEGTVRGRQIEVDNNGDIVVAGHFLGKASFGDQQLESVSTDFDLFVAKLDATGDPVWAKEATGILDDLCNAIAIDEQGAIFISGSFIGEMDLGNSIQISTPGFDDNLFLLKYDAIGDPVWARSLGNEVFNELSVALDMAIQDQSLLMCGYFRDELIIDQFTVFSEADDLNGFLAAFNSSDGAVEWLRRAPCSGQLLSTQVVVSLQGEISIAGAFLETAFFDEEQLVSDGLNDVFISRFDPMSTPVFERELKIGPIEISPVPARATLNIETELSEFSIEIYNVYGRIVLQNRNNKSIKIATLSPGNYWLQIESATFVKTIPFTKL